MQPTMEPTFVRAMQFFAIFLIVVTVVAVAIRHFTGPAKPWHGPVPAELRR